MPDHASPRPNPMPTPTDLEPIEIAAWSDQYRAADPTVTDACGFAVHEVGPAVVTIASALDVLAMNRAVGLGTLEPADDDTLDRAIACFDQANVPRYFLQISPGAQPADLPDRLTRRGLRHYNNWLKLHRSAQPLDARPISDLRVERIEPDRADDFARVIVEAFDWPAAMLRWFGALVGRARWHCYMAFDGEQPVATAGMFLDGRHAWFDLAATLESHRGRGAQSALIARRIDDARAAGCEHLSLETAEPKNDKPSPSYRNVIRMGFELAYTRANYIGGPEAQPK